MKKSSLYKIILLINLIFFSLTACNPPVLENLYKIGPEGGTIFVESENSDPLNGVKLEFPPGALKEERDISLTYISKSQLETENFSLGGKIDYYLGIDFQGGSNAFGVPVNLSVPSHGLSGYWFVGKWDDVIENNISQIFYMGTGIPGKLVDFKLPSFGRYIFFRSEEPIQLVTGLLSDETGEPIAGGIVASSQGRPFVTFTDKNGVFELPGGPCNSRTLLSGFIQENVLNRSSKKIGSGYLLTAAKSHFIPGIETQTAPVALIASKILEEVAFIPLAETEDPCPAPPRYYFTSEEQPSPPFHLLTNQTLQTYVISSEGSGLIGGNISPLQTFGMDQLTGLWSGSVDIMSNVVFSSSDPEIADIGESSGLVTANKKGSCHIGASIYVVKILPSGMICVYFVTITAPVIVDDRTLILEVINEEGDEITDIDGINPQDLKIYFNDDLWNFYNYPLLNLTPVPVTWDELNIRVVFNGMEQEKTLFFDNLIETRTESFIFTRQTIDLRDYIHDVSLTSLITFNWSAPTSQFYDIKAAPFNSNWYTEVHFGDTCSQRSGSYSGEAGLDFTMTDNEIDWLAYTHGSITFDFMENPPPCSGPTWHAEVQASGSDNIVLPTQSDNFTKWYIQYNNETTGVSLSIDGISLLAVTGDRLIKNIGAESDKLMQISLDASLHTNSEASGGGPFTIKISTVPWEWESGL